ncbi:hypothetical protein [Caulobacter sp. 17J80-11]|uniref:hypothetical protein n=1 Tax=Caulobacter sp. 17J80-11 TaxID=2763502 RepID=UPI0016538F55|nr:hypothetical protein [Caulobacter sp. 17J80-11]MBC6982981.1 hypothetical protein [Caulobacter sp. 17J80-11]
MARNLYDTLLPLGREARLSIDGEHRAIAVLGDGSVAELYQGFSGDLGDTLQVQRFSVTGKALSAPVSAGANGPTGANSFGGGLAPLDDGGFVATWMVAFSHSVTPQFSTFDKSGALRGGGDGLSGQASSVAAGGMPGGGFVIAEAASDLFGQFAAIVLQRYTAAHTPDGEAMLIATREDPFGGGLFYNDLQVQRVAGGGVELLWTSREGVHAALVKADGTVVESLLSDGFAADLDTARLADGRIVATWAEADGAASHIRAAVFDAADLAAGHLPSEIAVGDASVFAGEAEPEVVALRSGGWAVSWHDGDADGGTLGRTFGARGAAGEVFNAHGDFIGTDATGRVVSARVDAEGDVFVARYHVISAPIWIPGLDRIPMRLPGHEQQHAFHSEWAF